MPHSAAHARHRAEARHALDRVKHYREQGDRARADQWHAAWSLAETAADAELRERGGGARVLRLRSPPPLRPLPDGVPPLAAASLRLPFEAEPAEPAPLSLRGRHDRIEQALRAGGPNPLPEELTEESWRFHLTAFSARGPAACALLQAARTALQALGEALPDLPVPEAVSESLTEPVAEPVSKPIPEAAAPVAPDPLAAALERHRRIDAALRVGGPNPFPGELDEEDWLRHLMAFQVGGPYDCELLQDAEAAVEALVEFRPEDGEPEEDGEEEEEPALASGPFGLATLPACVRIYRESLPELTEAELRADLENCLDAGRRDTAAFIEAELQRREWEPPPETLGIVVGRSRHLNRESEPATGLTPPFTEPPTEEPLVGRRAERPSGSSVAELRDNGGAEPQTPDLTRPERPRRRAAAYSATSAEPVRPKPRQRRQPPAPHPAAPTAAPQPTGYTTAPAWIDAAGRTRTWALFSPAGERMAEIATRRDAEKLAELFNRLLICETPPLAQPLPRSST